MHIAIVTPVVLWPTHFATDLEIAQRHLDSGDSVTLLACDGELPSCDVNLGHEPARCLKCVQARTAGRGLLEGPVAVVPLSVAGAPGPEPHEPRTGFSTGEELREYRIEQFDIGYAVLSSLIFHHRDADVDLAIHHGEVSGLLRAAWNTYWWTDWYLTNHRVDRVYVFNTRFASTRGVLRACEKRGIECLVHERGCDLRHYELYPNVMPHDRELIDRRIREAWDNANPATRREIGAKWYRDKAAGIELYENSYVERQVPGTLPDGWDPSRRNIAVFTSSEDEFAAIGPAWENALYGSELRGVQSLVSSLSAMKHDLHVYVRVHPNLSGIANRQTAGLRDLAAPFLTMIPAESRISTYALLRAADSVLTFGSTVGIEAVFWGVPSILAGMSWYRDLGGTYNPSSHADVVDLVTRKLVPMNAEPALMYGYFFSTYGIPFQYFRATSFDEGEFKGRNVWRE